ncbi:hypothetical protein DPMN_167543 [Dreissena polymorpha]|uniref:Uncharacterized protein n=1 Tax=Dreissena polymorpha TaxID=45954 RepID=A0A9D4IWG1_DREPO|nr:hypothetical protein DPMN_167543 [Dreissena polymorpha]
MVKSRVDICQDYTRKILKKKDYAGYLKKREKEEEKVTYHLQNCPIQSEKEKNTRSLLTLQTHRHKKRQYLVLYPS